MKAYVFTDKSLERYAGQFVWLAIDTENGKNANFLAKYPIHVCRRCWCSTRRRNRSR